MPVIAKILTVRQIDTLTKPGYHSVGGAEGLRLQITAAGNRSWVLFHNSGLTETGKPRRQELGLGSCKTVSVAQAREAARSMREQLRQGIDPRAKPLVTQRMTFRMAAEEYLKAKSCEWNNVVHKQQWRSTLESYVYPMLGNKPVDEIDIDAVHAVLQPIWLEIRETATRVRGRIEKVLGWATALKHRHGPNPATWKGNLEHILPSQNKRMTTEHFPALPYQQVAGFVAALRQRTGTSARMLEFAILNASRTGEVRNATWEEINFAKRMWIIPAKRMKAPKEHRVPLSARALRLLEQIPVEKRHGLVFPNESGEALSNMAMLALIKKMHNASLARGEAGYIDPNSQKLVTVHGLRSAFRDWTAEETNYPNEMCEMALAHTVGDKVEAAYRRGDLLKKRFEMMDTWGAYCEGK
jgi:integrase